MLKIAAITASLLAFSPLVLAAQDFRCRVTSVVSAPQLTPQAQDLLDRSYLGKEFTVERRTGQMTGALKVLSPVPAQVIDYGSNDNSFKMVATMRKDQGAGAGTAVYSLVINTFDNPQAMPFLFTNNATAYVGTCTSF
jgi:hypothetical protein